MPPYPIGAMVQLRPEHLSAHVDFRVRGPGIVIAANDAYTTVRFTTRTSVGGAYGEVSRTERSVDRTEPHGCWMAVDQAKPATNSGDVI